MSIKEDINKCSVRYAGITFDDVANGEGLGAVFFTQHCPHHCKGCHNPSTWEKDGGEYLTKDVLEELFLYFKKVPFANRLTLSGGDPLSKYNLELTEYIIRRFKSECPDKMVWLYTGYDYDDIVMDANCIAIEEYHKSAKQRLYIANMCDVVVDRKFKINKRDVSLLFKGSSNQRIIDVKKSLEKGSVVLYE